MKLEKLGIVANTMKEGIGSIISDAIRLIPGRVELVGMKDISEILGGGLVKAVSSLSGCDAVIAFGGDGTILSAARLIEEEEIPILGIKIRSLGFLAEDNLGKALEDLFAGRYKIQERVRLEATHAVKGNSRRGTALNDIVIHGIGVSRVLHIKTEINGTLLGEYLSDGVIISTPTGSTAYSLAAGGPIIDPINVEAFIITPLCPHSLSVRPVVLSSEEAFSVEVLEAAGRTLMTIDGQEAIEIGVGEKISFRKSEKRTRLVVAEDYNFYDLVREKLKWGGVLRER